MNSASLSNFTKDALYIAATSIPIALISGVTPLAIPAFVFAGANLLYMQQRHSKNSRLHKAANHTPQKHCPIFNECAQKAGMSDITLRDIPNGSTSLAHATLGTVRTDDLKMMYHHITDDEKKVIYAHELSHLKHNDLAAKYHNKAAQWTYETTFWVGVVTLNFGLVGLSVAVSLMHQLINQRYSRSIEKRADRDALELTKDLKSSVSWMEKAILDYSKPKTGWRNKLKIATSKFFDSHPSRNKRIKNVEKHAKKLGLTQ